MNSMSEYGDSDDCARFGLFLSTGGIVWNRVSACYARSPLSDGVRRSSNADMGEAAADEAAAFEQDRADYALSGEGHLPQDGVAVPVEPAMGELAAPSEDYGWPIYLAVGELTITDCRFVARDERESNDFPGVSLSRHG